MAFGGFGMFQRPRGAMWHKDAPGSGLQGGKHVGLHRISDHQRLFGRGAMAGKDPAIGGAVFFREDLDTVKEPPQSRSRQFSLLVHQIAFGDQQQPVRPGQGLERVANAGQQFQRMGQKIAPRGHYLSQYLRRNPAVTDANGGFHHRKRESLHPISIERDVTPFSGQLLGGQLFRRAPGRQQAQDLLARPAKEALIVPKGVVGIKAKGGQGQGALHLWGFAALGGAHLQACCTLTPGLASGQLPQSPEIAMKRLSAAVLLSLMLSLPAGAGIVVATDAEFAPLVPVLAEASGTADVELLILPGADLKGAEADLILGADGAAADHLTASGEALAQSRITYAMGRSGTDAALLARDGVLMQRAAENEAALAFHAFLLTPEAWDLIVAAGFGAH